MFDFSHLNDAVSKECPNTCGLQIHIHGDSVFEQYYNGFHCSDRLHVTSVTKSVLSALVGIAFEEGHLSDINEPISRYFPEYRPLPTQSFYENITLLHLLTMTVPLSFPGPMEPFEEICSSDDWCKSTLSQIGYVGPPFPFRYSSFCAHLISSILKKSTGKNARDYANEMLCPKIGMEQIPVYPMESYDFDSLFGKKLRGWASDPCGITTGGWGLTLTLRDMSALGQLYLQNGTWKGEQILPAKWVHDSIRPNPSNYGYLWWTFSEPFEFFAAIGDGGNIICCIPKKDTVISMISSFMPNASNRVSFIKEHILPYL